MAHFGDHFVLQEGGERGSALRTTGDSDKTSCQFARGEERHHFFTKDIEGSDEMVHR